MKSARQGRGEQVLKMRSTVLALVAGSMCLFGCPPAAVRSVRAQESAAHPEEAQRAFGAAFDHFAAGRWSDAATAFAGFEAAHPGSALVPESMYRRGAALNRLGRLDEARHVLKGQLAAHPTSSYSAAVRAELTSVEAKLGLSLGVPARTGEAAPPLTAVNLEPPRASATPVPSAFSASAATVEKIRGLARRAAAGDVAAVDELVNAIDGEATTADLEALLSVDLDASAGALCATKLARLWLHLGELEAARSMAQRALSMGAAGSTAQQARAVLDRLSLREGVKPMTLGVILPLSGKFKKIGESIQDGMSLVLNKREGVELVYKDSAGEPEQAVQAVEQLARDGVIAIIGPVAQAEAAPAAARAQELGIPMISLARTEGVTNIGPNVFRNALTNSAQGRALARYAASVVKLKTAAAFSPNISSGEEVAGAFWDAFETAGGEMKAYEVYDHDTTTFSAPLRRLVARDSADVRPELKAEVAKALAAEANPYKRRRLMQKLASQATPIIDFDVLLVPDYYKTIGLIAPALAVEDIITNGCDEKAMENIKKTQKRDIHPVLMLGTNVWNSPELVTRGGRYVQCSVFVDGFYADSMKGPTRRFVEEFKATFARKPGLFEAQGYDTAGLAKELLVKSRPQSREAFRELLAGLRKYPGAMGETSFGPDREADRPLFFLTVDKAGLSELDVTISGAAVKAP